VPDPEDESAFLGELKRAGYELRVREPGHRMLRTAERDVHIHNWSETRGLQISAVPDRLGKYPANGRPMSSSSVSWPPASGLISTHYAEAKGPFITSILASHLTKDPPHAPLPFIELSGSFGVSQDSVVAGETIDLTNVFHPTEHESDLLFEERPLLPNPRLADNSVVLAVEEEDPAEVRVGHFILNVFWQLAVRMANSAHVDTPVEQVARKCTGGARWSPAECLKGLPPDVGGRSKQQRSGLPAPIVLSGLAGGR
jgi:hypothetical protein